MALAISVATFNLPKAGPKQITGDTFSICSGGGKRGIQKPPSKKSSLQNTVSEAPHEIWIKDKCYLKMVKFNFWILYADSSVLSKLR